MVGETKKGTGTEEKKEHIYCVVVHIPSGLYYCLNRNYGLIDETIDVQWVIKNHVDKWKEWKNVWEPEWAKKRPKEEFTAFWLS